MIIGLDIGFGDIKIAYENQDKHYHYVKIPAIAQKFTLNEAKKFLETINNKRKEEIIDNFLVRIDNTIWGVGNIAKFLGSGMRVYEVDRKIDSIGKEITPIFYKSSIALVNILNDSFENEININKVVMGLPAQLYYEEEIINILPYFPADFEIQSMNLNKEAKVKINSHSFLIQPFGTAYTEFVNRSIKEKETVMVIDIGFRTTDIIIIEFRNEESYSIYHRITNPDFSVFGFSLMLDLPYLFSSKNLPVINDEETILSLIKGKGKIVINDLEYDFSNEFIHQQERFLNQIISYLIRLRSESRVRMGKTIEKVIICGGGAYIFDNLAEHFYKNNFKAIIAEKPEYSNALGFLLYGKRRP